jgi:putative spermidine/putrescine transport system substrate-binding protein
MMQRRSFLITLGSMAIGSGLTGCQGQDRDILRVLALKNSLPPQLLKEFTKSITPTPKVELVPEGQFKEIIAQLQTWYKTGQAEAKGLKVPLVSPAKSPEYIPDLVSIGDAWLPKAIQENLIQPIEVKNLPNWGKLAPRWHELAQRDDRGNISAKGQIWGVPYRWGTTVIIYRRDKLAAAKIPIPQDWEDLWNPQLRQRISLLDRSREVIGLTLKKLGHSYNHTDLSQISNLKSELEKLDQQVKFYSAETYLQPLIIGDTWVAVGWSSDVIDLIKKTPNLGAIIPRSGTSISADLWVQPTVKSNRDRGNRSKLVQQWLDYCLQPKVSSQISLFTSGTAPLFTNMKSSEILSDIRQDALVLPPKTILDKSDFIYPLSSTSQIQFDRLWHEIHQSQLH